MCSYDNLARRVRHRHVDLKLVRVFGERRHGKLGDDAAQLVCILTARGLGYRMTKPGAR